jgi:hypothetical protein
MSINRRRPGESFTEPGDTKVKDSTGNP